MMRKKILCVFIVAIYIVSAVLWIKSATKEEDMFRIFNELSLSNWREYEHVRPCWLGMDNMLKFSMDDYPHWNLEDPRLTRYDFEREVQNEEIAYECALQMCSILHWRLHSYEMRDGRYFEIYRDDENAVWLMEQYGEKWSGGLLLQDGLLQMLLYDDGKAIVLYP